MKFLKVESDRRKVKQKFKTNFHKMNDIEVNTKNNKNLNMNNCFDDEELHDEFLKSLWERSNMNDSSLSLSDKYPDDVKYKRIRSQLRNISFEIFNLKQKLKLKKHMEVEFVNNLNYKSMNNIKLFSQVMDEQYALLHEIKSLRKKLNKLKVCKKTK